MKRMKKIFAMLIAMTMVLAMSMTAWADGEEGASAAETGSITVKNAKVGATYTAFRIFDATFNEETSGIVYTATETQKVFYEGYKNDNPFDFTKENENYHVVKKADKNDSDVIAFFQQFVTKTADGVVVAETLKNNVQSVAPITANSSEVVFNNLPYGYYLVQSNTGATVTIDSTTPNVEVIDKNFKPSWKDNGKSILKGETEVKENSANYNDVVNFRVSINATNYDGEKIITEYIVTDKLADGFTYNEKSLKVYVNGKEATYELKTAEEGETFKISIPWATASTTPNTPITYTFKNTTDPSVITVEYSATLKNDESVVISGDGNKNTAEFTYKMIDPDDTGTPENPKTPEDPKPNDKPEPKTTTTYTYALAIEKVDANDTTIALEGATFTITDGTNPVPVSAVAGKQGVYKYDAAGSNVVETPLNGIVIIEGVEGKTYTLTETKAPDGYNLLGTPQTVTAQKSGESKVTVYFDSDGKAAETQVTGGVSMLQTVSKVVVENNKGLELPETGALGTAIFAIVGVGAIIGGTLMRSRKENEEK